MSTCTQTHITNRLRCAYSLIMLIKFRNPTEGKLDYINDVGLAYYGEDVHRKPIHAQISVFWTKVLAL